MSATKSTAETPEIKAKSKTLIFPYFSMYLEDKAAKIDEQITPNMTMASPIKSGMFVSLKLSPNAINTPRIATNIANNLILVMGSIRKIEAMINVQMGIVANTSPARPAVVNVKPNVNRIGKPAK